MAVSYKRLWKLLIDRKMSKAELRRLTGISPNTMTKLNRDEEVALTVLCKICTVLNADIGEVVEVLTPDRSAVKREGVDHGSYSHV